MPLHPQDRREVRTLAQFREDPRTPGGLAEMKVEVTRYRKPDGWPTRHWAVFVNDDLLAVTLYRKGRWPSRRLSPARMTLTLS